MSATSELFVSTDFGIYFALHTVDKVMRETAKMLCDIIGSPADMCPSTYHKDYFG